MKIRLPSQVRNSFVQSLSDTTMQWIARLNGGMSESRPHRLKRRGFLTLQLTVLLGPATHAGMQLLCQNS